MAALLVSETSGAPVTVTWLVVDAMILPVAASAPVMVTK